MPVRLIREGILTSERIAKLNWAEEVFYRRLMSVVDDFGRYYATPMLLRAACYPLHLNKVSDPDIEKWLTACVEAALVRVYPAQDGKRYLELLDFRQQVRAKESKFPQPLSSCLADAKQLIATAHLDEDEDGDDKRSAEPPGFTLFWQTWPRSSRKGGKSACLAKWRKFGLEKQAQAIVAHVQSMCLSADWQKQGGEFIPAPLSYLNQARWDGADIGESSSSGMLAGAI